MKIGFLFNHYVPHQVLHAAPIAFALSSEYRDIDVRVICATPEILDVIRTFAGFYPDQRCSMVTADTPALLELVDPILRNLVFARKEAVLRYNIDLFRDLDVLVLPEKTSLQLKKREECRHLKFVYTHHGAGDRDATFYPELREFDLVLTSGAKIRNRLIQSGLVEEQRCAIVGYPKFELAGRLGTPPRFPDGKPVVLYTPHYALNESSWRKMGRQVLDYFFKQNDFNLIFAPHVLLYQRAWRHRAWPLGRYRHCPHIHVDTGSPAGIDMTYTMTADIYLGDVSSQVYEFLQEPRPCIFLNAQGVTDWRERENFLCWRAGEVIDDIKVLPAALQRARDNPAQYHAEQERLFADTFDMDGTPPSRRAAEAIATAFT